MTAQELRDEDILEMLAKYNKELLNGEPEMTLEEYKDILGIN